ncbi:phosphoenolpyruvate--protein phosphotransferase [Marispirochaeta sp.]|uniref:phosphoenolpyruvate--protein phosphotransferase n=1 Tax=Marispirochaeta sp. TaxID=2038653 RepID=UPI0029C8F183|nr:phosphoenolpyruvate--protein phosphotransferase [Marispirochaeta sp.]
MLKGIPSSTGIGTGSVYLLHEREVPLGRTGPSSSRNTSGARSHTRRSTESEMERFSRGLEVASAYYTQLIERIREKIGEDEAEIFEGHLEILTGEDMAEAVEEAIMEHDAIAERAVIDFVEETAKEFEELESDYFKQRAGDLRDIGRRLAEAIYYGSISDPGELPENSVIVAEELTPSATARLDTERVAAIITEKGGRTSHAAILARSLSIPCVTGVDGLIAAVRSGQQVLVDGDAGTVDTKVNQEKIQAAQYRKQKADKQTEKRRRWSGEAVPQLADGSPYGLMANVGGVAEAEQAASFGAAGIGLFRTEFLFMRFSDFPGLDQQADEYRAVCAAMAPAPVIVRLLDCGADKPLPYASHPQEDNPFLGERGIRYLLAREDRLRTQIEAIARIFAEGYPVKAMIPMVISASEIDAVRSLVPASAAGLPVGIMVETPASVMIVETLARKADFISIGTNDLVQYLLTVDRGNPRVSAYYQEFHPAVFSAISRIVEGAHAAGIHVGVCGDMASHADSALALLALGVDEISAGINAIPELKACLSKISSSSLKELAVQLKSAPDADAARAAARTLVPDNLSPWMDE